MHSNIAHLSVSSLAIILTNRLVLNLKQAGDSHTHYESSAIPSLTFVTNSFVGNLGAPFRVRNEDDKDEEPEYLGNDEHELNHEGQATLIVEDA